MSSYTDACPCGSDASGYACRRCPSTWTETKIIINRPETNPVQTTNCQDNDPAPQTTSKTDQILENILKTQQQTALILQEIVNQLAK